jgi:serine/threonine protein kinase
LEKSFSILNKNLKNKLKKNLYFNQLMSTNNFINNPDEESNDSEYEESNDSEYEESSSSDENLSQTENLELTGEIIKNYNIICELGRGSFSIVWLAFNISNNNFYALKVQNPTEYKDGLSEIKFVSKLPKVPNVFNNIVEYFIEIRDENKYLCSAWELHCSNIDGLIRKGDYENGFPIDKVKIIMKQLIESVRILHKKFKVFHGDIKSDNILIKGINNKDAFLIKRYTEEKFFEKYIETKNKYWLSLGKNLKKIDSMNKVDKMRIRKKIHQDIVEKITEEYSQSDISKYSINSKYLEPINISLADFGTYCEEHNYYEESFGTRYYQAPEIILMGKCSFPVDIWAIGCTFYELLSGKLLFDPIKDSEHSRDYYHLCLINETCGKFSPNFLKKTKFYKNYFDSKSNIINNEVPEPDRLIRKINKLELDKQTTNVIIEILNNTLTIDPLKRWTIDDLSKCSFFK